MRYFRLSRRLFLSLLVIVVIGFTFLLIRPQHVQGLQNAITTVSAASFTAELSAEGIAAGFGAKLATRLEVASTLPLPTNLAGTTVKVGNQLAPLFFVSPGQINYQIPAGSPAGNLQVTVTSGDGTVSTGTVMVSNVAPAIFTANSSGTGLPAAVLLRVAASGQQTFERVDQPLVFNQTTDRLFLLLYLSGVRASAPGTVKALIAGNELPTEFVAAPGFVGLDQVNVELPGYLSGRGRVALQIKAGTALSNAVEIEMGGADLRAATTTTVTSSANPAVAGQEVAFTVRINAPGNSRIPSGNVMLTENGVMVGKKPLDNAGQASFAFVFTSTGGRNIAASYEGDNFFKGSNGALNGQQTVTKAQATVFISSSANPVSLAQTVTLTAEARPVSPSTIVPTGIVQFKENNLPLGTPITLVNGRAVFSVSTLALGARNITAEYYGDPNFQPANSTGYTQTVGTAPLQITGITRPASVYASEEITINGSGFTANSAEHEVKFIADDGKETTGQLISAAADQLQVRIPFGTGSGKIKVVVGGREIESSQRMEIGTSVSGFVQSFKDGNRIPVAGLSVALIEPTGKRIDAVTNGDGSFVLKSATPLQSPAFSRIAIGAQAVNGLNYPAQVRRITPLVGRDTQYSGDNGLANIIEVTSNGTTATSIIAENSPVSESLSVSAPANPEEVAGIITSGQVTFDTNNSTIAFPGGGSGSLTLTVLDPERAPSNLPTLGSGISGSYFSSTIVQITPFGATLNPGGKLTFPNSNGIAAGTPVRLFRFDQTAGSATLGQFVDVGAATISVDGTKIETATNAITQSSYYFVSRLWPTATITGLVSDADGRAVRRAVVTARGQSVFTGNNGGFVLPGVPVISPNGGNDQVTIEVSYVRPDGSIARTNRTVTISTFCPQNTCTVTGDLVLPKFGVNRQPQIFAPLSLLVNEGETRDFSLIVSDPEGQMVNATVTGAAFASLANAGNGVYKLLLSPPVNSARNYILEIIVSDSSGLTVRQSINLIVQRPDNNRPTASYQSAITNEDTATGITLDAKNTTGGALSFTVLNNPAHGSLTGVAPNLIYTPAANYNGADSFTYKVSSDSRESNVAMVFIAVNPINDAPVLKALNQSTLIVNPGDSVRLDFAATDVDTEQTLSFSATGLPAGASLVPTATGAQLLWIPALSQGGKQSIIIRAGDNGFPPLQDLLVVEITVAAKWAQTSGIESGLVVSLLATNNSVFAGTVNGGIFRSSDQGSQWTPVNVGLENLNVYSFTVVGNVIFAGTGAGVFRTTDNGRSWIAARTGISTDFAINALLVNGQYLFAATNGGGVYRSQNFGQSWEPVSTGLTNTDVRSLSAVNSTLFAGTNGAGAFRSNDFGLTWTPVNNGIANLCVETIAVIGSTLFAGTANNIYSNSTGRGIFRSINFGQTWELINSGLTSIDVQSLKARGTELLAATNGGGVFRSSNQGTTWTGLSVGLDVKRVFALDVSSNNLYAGTYAGGVFRSTDNGANWKVSNSGLSSASVFALATTGVNVFAGTDGGGIFCSSNDGQSWVPVNNGLTSLSVRALITTNVGETLLAGTTDGIFRSTNQGKTWTDVSSGLTHRHVLALLVNGSSIFAGTGAGVFVSTNGGQSWTPTATNWTSGFVTALAVRGATLFAATSTSGIYSSTNEGRTWVQINNGLTSNDVRSLVVVGDALLAGTFNGLFRSTNNGLNWAEIKNGILDEFGRGQALYALTVSGGITFAGSSFNGVYLSSDQGQSWRKLNDGLPLKTVALSFAVKRTGIFVGTFSNVSFLTNNFQSWSETNTNLTNRFINAVHVGSNNWYAGTLGGGVFRSGNQGQNWTPVNSGLPQSANVQTLASNGSALFAGTFGSGVYRSFNDGGNWTIANAGLANLSINAFSNGAGGLFAATDSGVFRSTNSGDTWVAAGLTNIRITSLTMNGSILYAATYGNGVYQSTNNGGSWVQVNNGLTNTAVTSLIASGGLLFAGTDGGGVFRSINGGVSWAAINSNLPSRLSVTAFAASGSKLYAGSVYGVFATENNGTAWKQVNAGLLDIYVTSLAVKDNSVIAGTRTGGVFVSTIPTARENEPVRVTAIQPGQLVSGALTIDSQIQLDSFGRIYFFDAYIFNVSSPGTGVAIDMRSPDFDAYILLYRIVNNRLVFVAEDDYNGGLGNGRVENNNALLPTVLDPGDYVIFATSADGEHTATGKYTMRLATNVIQGIGYGTNLPAASIALGDLQTSAGDYLDAYWFAGTQGDQIQVRMSSAAFDSFLLLQSYDGRLLVADDNSGGGLSSLISFTLPQTGPYIVLATPFEPNVTGNYSLSLTRSSGFVSGGEVKPLSADKDQRSRNFRDAQFGGRLSRIPTSRKLPSPFLQIVPR